MTSEELFIDMIGCIKETYDKETEILKKQIAPIQDVLDLKKNLAVYTANAMYRQLAKQKGGEFMVGGMTADQYVNQLLR